MLFVQVEHVFLVCDPGLVSMPHPMSAASEEHIKPAHKTKINHLTHNKL